MSLSGKTRTDRLRRYNATPASNNRAIGSLISIVVAWAALAVAAHAQTRSARDVLVQFCELDSKGGQFTTIGQQEIATLFKSPGAPRRYKAVVIKDFVVSFPSKGPGKASFYVEYISLGEIDLAKAMFLSGPRIKVRGTFDVSRES